ncbi:hypothetical protein HYC85_017264 [Camellia sinensis]|uniref:Uncharacterized protein n=1 Tax=Camellia sinensis TaxID=4442 RepID=A0A7J7H5J0_CAMSI|nr:hypothetical protein HYC85_017264 [Camellia sinensis]
MATRIHPLLKEEPHLSKIPLMPKIISKLLLHGPQKKPPIKPKQKPPLAPVYQHLNQHCDSGNPAVLSRCSCLSTPSETEGTAATPTDDSNGPVGTISALPNKSRTTGDAPTVLGPKPAFSEEVCRSTRSKSEGASSTSPDDGVGPVVTISAIPIESCTTGEDPSSGLEPNPACSKERTRLRVHRGFIGFHITTTPITNDTVNIFPSKVDGHPHHPNPNTSSPGRLYLSTYKVLKATTIPTGDPSHQQSTTVAATPLPHLADPKTVNYLDPAKQTAFAPPSNARHDHTPPLPNEAPHPSPQSTHRDIQTLPLKPPQTQKIDHQGMKSAGVGRNHSMPETSADILAAFDMNVLLFLLCITDL